MPAVLKPPTDPVRVVPDAAPESAGIPGLLPGLTASVGARFTDE